MIRFLQREGKATKIIFGVIIGVVTVGMVIYLVPGLMDAAGASDASDVYATVRAPGVWGRIFGESDQVKMEEVNLVARRELQQQHYPDTLLPLVVPQVGNQLVQQTIMKQEADRLHLQVSDDDLLNYLKTGPYAEYLFPNGKYVGDDGYINFIQMAMGPDGTRTRFETDVKQEMELRRLVALVTSGVSVSDSAVRAAYLQQGSKVKFDYAVVSLEDLKKTINPSDADLQAFFKQNAGRYNNAIPETRKIEYAAFDASKIPGGKPQISDADVLAYYNAHQADYKTDEEVKTRHILITAKAGADAQTDAAAKAKAQDILNQLKAGGNFAELAKKYSEDPGSKDAGGELPMMPTSGLDPAYAKAAMALNPGQTSGLVKSQFGYHIIQTEQKQPAGEKPLADVKASIVQTLQQQKAGAAEQQFATQLSDDAKKNGLDKAAAAHGLKVVTTDYLAKTGTIGGLTDSTTLLQQAFAADKGAPPATASTGDGFAVYQVVDVKPAHAPSFTEYKSHVLDDYRADKAPAMMEDETRKLDDRAKVLNDLKKAAAELKVPVKSSDLVGQDAQVSDLGAMSGPGAVAFTLPKGQISGPINTGETGVVLVVTDQQQPTAAEIADHMDQTREQLLNAQREVIFRVFMGDLTQRYEKGGAIRLSKQAGAPGLPSGS